LHILVDSGSEDDFYKKGQLEPQRLREAAQQTGRGEDEVNIRIQPGYDHSYYFVRVTLPLKCRS
jgi:S-formylglutathione hydrolase